MHVIFNLTVQMWSIRWPLHFVEIIKDCPHIYAEANMNQGNKRDSNLFSILMVMNYLQCLIMPEHLLVH
jgi:hypothetical protein